MARSSLALPFILGASLAISCGKDPEVLKREYLRSGNQYFAQNKFAEAIIEYRRAVQQDPKFGEARYALAEAYLAAGQPRNAFGEYVRAADLMPGHVDAQLKAGDVLLRSGQF